MPSGLGSCVAVGLCVGVGEGCVLAYKKFWRGA